jgi:general bacterial porin, GBP family
MEIYTMKKSLFALAALTAFAGAAQAQSSVTLYGILDTGVAYNNNASTAGSSTAAVDGILNTSRWGFKGTEDLGGGLKANFVLLNHVQTHYLTVVLLLV